MIGLQCIACLYFGDKANCAAFPDGIPEEIITGKVSHTKPYKGDNGILYKSVLE